MLIPDNSTPTIINLIAVDRSSASLGSPDGDDAPSALLLIIDRYPKYSAAFRSLLADAGVEPVRLPARSPYLNACAERFVRSIKDECLSRMIFFSERSLRKAAREFAAHYHAERNHQGLDNRPIDSNGRAESAVGRITCRERLGGMLRFYDRAAA